ncbi:hypothetical protein TcWFU_000523 [Taenia crassiceps]|uniref:Complex I-15 kDa n=1 Tax=Taenia crassiceps TaxID=6207 RepID=A0ABR4QBZ3_9CEST
MSYCETNPEKLRKLNDEAKSKPDRELGFYPSAMSVTDKWLARVFSPSDPYHSATNLHLGTTWGTNLRPFRPKFCQIMERDYLRVGIQNSDRICRIYWEDLMECTTHEKSRVLYMEKVRKQKKLEPMSPPPLTSIHRPT